MWVGGEGRGCWGTGRGGPGGLRPAGSEGHEVLQTGSMHVAVILIV